MTGFAPAHVRGVLIAVLVASTAAGQSATHTVRGTVFDSVAGVPLVGAVVEILSSDSAHRFYSGISGSSGAYRIGGIPSGRYAISFQHRSVVALGLESPVSGFDAGNDSVIRADLAIPSGSAVRASKCGRTASDSSAGMLAGFVLDPRAMTAGDTVDVRWLEVTVAGKLGTTPHTARAIVGSEGTYIACGVPADVWLDARVAVAGRHLIDGQTFVPSGGATRLDFQLVDSGVTRGTASVAGRVFTDEHAPVESGRATISALGIEVPIRDGRFTLSGVPAGTWNVEARALGFEPHALLAQLGDGTADSVLITLTHKPQALDAVNVIGKASRDIKTLDEIMARSLVSSGTRFLPGNVYLRNAETPSDVLKAARGFRMKDLETFYVRGCGDRPVNASGGAARPAPARSAPKAPLPYDPTKEIVVYLDGVRFPLGLKALQTSVRMSQVLAIEAYSDMMFAPPLWRTNDACAVVAIWTKH